MGVKGLRNNLLWAETISASNVPDMQDRNLCTKPSREQFDMGHASGGNV